MLIKCIHQQWRPLSFNSVFKIILKEINTYCDPIIRYTYNCDPKIRWSDDIVINTYCDSGINDQYNIIQFIYENDNAMVIKKSNKTIKVNGPLVVEIGTDVANDNVNRSAFMVMELCIKHNHRYKENVFLGKRSRLRSKLNLPSTTKTQKISKTRYIPSWIHHSNYNRYDTAKKEKLI
eukprot:927841_1